MWTLGEQPGFTNRGPEHRHGSPRWPGPRVGQAGLPPRLGELALILMAWGARGARSPGREGEGWPMMETCSGLFSLLPQALLELGPMKMHVPFQK